MVWAHRVRPNFQCLQKMTPEKLYRVSPILMQYQVVMSAKKAKNAKRLPNEAAKRDSFAEVGQDSARGHPNAAADQEVGLSGEPLVKEKGKRAKNKAKSASKLEAPADVGTAYLVSQAKDIAEAENLAKKVSVDADANGIEHMKQDKKKKKKRKEATTAQALDEGIQQGKPKKRKLNSGESAEAKAQVRPQAQAQSNPRQIKPSFRCEFLAKNISYIIYRRIIAGALSCSNLC